MKKMQFPFFLMALVVPLLSNAQDKINQMDKDSLRQGKWVKYYESGVKRYEGVFKNNIPQGTFKYYYDNKEFEEIQSILTYNSSNNKASATLFHHGGEIMAKGNYVNQLKDSIWSFYDNQGRLSNKENYIQGKKHGLSVTYYLEEKVAEEKYWDNGVEHGSWKQYFKNGNLQAVGHYVHGNLDGAIQYYFPNGTINIEGNFQDAVKQGVWTEYNDSGKVYVKRYYELGNLMKTEKINGLFTEYYPMEIPKEEVGYKEGKKDGPFKEYYEAGEWKTREFKLFEDNEAPPEEEPQEKEEYLAGQQLKRQGNYKEDQLDGEITYYKPDGSIDKVEYYKNGKQIKN